MHTKLVTWQRTRLAPLDPSLNVALAAHGSRATASSSSPGFHPGGVINGNRTLEGWGRGNGWRAPTPTWHPNWWGEWVEVDFPGPRTIDTVLVFTFPRLVGGRSWRGARDFQVQYRDMAGTWTTLADILGNEADCVVSRTAPVEAAAIRVWITRNHCPEESGNEAGFTPADEGPRLVEIEACRLGERELYLTEPASREIEDGSRGRVALFHDAAFAEAASAPQPIAAELRRAGYGVTVLDADEVCEPRLLAREHFDILVHLHGRFMPLGMNLFDFLEAGGHLLTAGGRAFTELKQRVEGTWRGIGLDPEATASAGRYNDAIRPYREQLGIFSIPNAELRHADSLEAAGGQFVVPEDLRADGPFAGWAAYGMTGELLPLDESACYAAEGRLPQINHATRDGIHSNRSEEPMMWGMSEDYPPLFVHPCARWIPLLVCRDAFGRNRGPAAAMLMHHEGCYRGSHWAFFGVEDRDLFADGKLLRSLGPLADALVRGLCIHGLDSEYACYRRGEAVNVTYVVDNTGTRPCTVALTLEIAPADDPASPLHSESLVETLGPGEWKRVSSTWSPGAFNTDLYRIRVTARLDGALIDALEGGFAAWQPQVLARGPRVEFVDNYFRFDGVPRYTVGARDSGLHLPGQPDENPLGWDRQYRRMRDYGMRVTSPIHIDWTIPGLGWGRLDGEHPVPEQILRRLDAQVLLAQKHGLVYAPGIFFAYEQQAMHNPAASAAICRALGERYRDVPGIMFYLSDDTLKHTPEAYNAWVKICVDAFSSSGRAYLVTTEFGFRQDWPDALRHGCRYLSFNAGSCFQRAVGDPVYDRLVDMRPAGKSFTYGEFVRRIPAGTAEDFYGYLAPPHLNFGMGYAMALNWKWHTGWHAIWPSDVIFPDNTVPKAHLPAFRNEAQFFRQFRPVYRAPGLMVVMPSVTWLANTEGLTRYLVDFLRRLMELRADFACVDDTDLQLVTPATRALVFPMAMELADESYDRLRDLVASGAWLFATGDISRLPGDPPGAASRASRLEQLFGVRRLGPAFAAGQKAHTIAFDRFLPRVDVVDGRSIPGFAPYSARPWIRVEPLRAPGAGARILAAAADGTTMLTRIARGRGEAWFTPDANPKLPKEVFAAFLREAGIRTNAIRPDAVSQHCFRIDTATGPVYTLVSFPWDRGRREVTVDTEAGKVSLVLEGMALGVVHARAGGGLGAVETQGPVTVDGATLLKTDAHLMVSALDGGSLGDSAVVLVHPITAGSLGLDNAVVDRAEVGELVDGRWRPRAGLATARQGRFLCCRIDERCSTLLVLFHRHGEHERARAAVEAMLRC